MVYKYIKLYRRNYLSSNLFIGLCFFVSACSESDINQWLPTPQNSASAHSSLNSEIAYIKMDGIQFHIPRQYSSMLASVYQRAINSNFANYDADREASLDFFTLDFAFPEMSPLKQATPATHKIKTFIKSSARAEKEYSRCRAGECKGLLQSIFQRHIGATRKGPPYCLQAGQYDNRLALDAYLVYKDLTNEINLFIKGDPCQPQFYLICETDQLRTPNCTQYLIYKEKILAYYIFSRELLLQHKNIHTKWLAKLNEFTQQAGNSL